MTQQDSWIRAEPNATNNLGVYVALPADFTITQGFTDYVHVASFDEQKPYVRVRPTTDVANATFALVLLPTTSAQWASRPTVTALAGDESQGAGVEVGWDGPQTHLIRTVAIGTLSAGTYALTGQAASIYRNGSGDLTAMFIADATVLADQDGARPLIEASAETTLEVQLNGAAMAVKSADPTAGIRIYGPSVDLGQVTVNGGSATATRDGDWVVLP